MAKQRNPYGPKGHGRHSRWQWLKFGDRAMMHCCPRSRAEQTIADMTARDAGLDGRWGITSFYMDSGGMCRVDRPDISVRFSGLKVTMPCEDVGYFIAKLASMNERFFPDGKRYYKLKAFYARALVLTPGQRDELLRRLRAVYQEAEARTAAFEHGLPALNAVLAEANNRNRKPHQAPVLPEQVGVDRTARFRKPPAKA